MPDYLYQENISGRAVIFPFAPDNGARAHFLINSEYSTAQFETAVATATTFRKSGCQLLGSD